MFKNGPFFNFQTQFLKKSSMKGDDFLAEMIYM